MKFKGEYVMSKKVKVIILSVAAVFLVAAIVTTIITFPLIQMFFNSREYKFSDIDLSKQGDRIYFLNTQGADAILIESDGKFALVDAAEDNDNPRGFEGLELAGYEDYVVDCIKKIAGDENGRVTLDFVVGTHSHSDHIGGFDTLILDKDITVKKAFIKEYDESKIDEYEVAEWDNKEVYEQMVNACKERDVEIVHNIPTDKFAFGNFTVSFYNTEPLNASDLVGENENSLGVLIEKGEERAFLAGDINNYQGTEDKIAAEIGEVDLLKVGHHGYGGSTSNNFAKILDPDIAILTNSIHCLHKPVLRALNAADAAIYGTKEHMGIVAEFSYDDIVLYDNIDKAIDSIDEVVIKNGN